MVLLNNISPLYTLWMYSLLQRLEIEQNTRRKNQKINKHKKIFDRNCCLVQTPHNLYHLFMNKMFIVHMYSSVETDLLIHSLRRREIIEINVKH